MLGRQPVRVTYAHKKRRIQDTSRKLLSSPLEVLPLEMDDLTRTQMARRMLKRSRRVALAEQLEDKNVEHIREHLAKRIKRTRDRVSNADPAIVPSDLAPQDDTVFQTPFPSSEPSHELTAVRPSVPEQLSPVPITKRVISRTSSRNLKENSQHSQTLASPFKSRPGSAVSSPKHQNRERSSRRTSRGSLHAKHRTLSGIFFKENARRVSRKGSAASLRDAGKEAPRHIKHQRYPSSPSASYMRPQFAHEDWISPPKALSRAFDAHIRALSSGGSTPSDGSFYTDKPQFCSTPAIFRQQKLPDNNTLGPSLLNDPTELDDPDVEMMDGTALFRRQTIHLSGDSIFSSSDDFTIGTPSARGNDGTITERSNLISPDEAPSRATRQATRETGRTLAGLFVAEYDVPLSDLPCSPASTVSTKMVAVPKQSVGEFGFPGTSPAHGGNLVIRASRNVGRLTPPSSPPKATVSCPSSPATDLALGLRSMDLCGNPDALSDGETSPPASILETRSRSLQNAFTKALTKKSAKRKPARDRAGTIRASDFAKPVGSTSGAVPGLSSVRRTRSGTVVGPTSKLASKSAGLPGRATRTGPTAGLAVVRPGSGSGSDDELLLKTAWIEDLEYLGLRAPLSGRDAEADDMNLGSWHGLESGPPRRLGLRRR